MTVNDGQRRDTGTVRNYDLWAAANGPMGKAKRRAPLTPEQIDAERAEAARIFAELNGTRRDLHGEDEAAARS